LAATPLQRLFDEAVKGQTVDERGNAHRIEAMASALAEPWSNGQTEGQITKLKLVKRQMNGRANLDLL
jgi:transposase